MKRLATLFLASFMLLYFVSASSASDKVDSVKYEKCLVEYLPKAKTDIVARQYEMSCSIMSSYRPVRYKLVSFPNIVELEFPHSMNDQEALDKAYALIFAPENREIKNSILSRIAEITSNGGRVMPEVVNESELEFKARFEAWEKQQKLNDCFLKSKELRRTETDYAARILLADYEGGICRQFR